ncbi:PLP-dependent aminotransferase family protein [Aneurinibacillus aneurinilyticus]|uniref:MocR-like pyridoxine biosynthesis transcription factor PdxR n=1 Tax=Aneurinibacillus aneurinilyticus TaxID=1391 RepID=UPI002E1FB415|nr:PLP-dependent aminotransferase family protein [Aneurinibacillus aneurinilyticus]
MDWKPSRHSDIPIYQQIVDFIEKRIIYGEYPPGSILPSERTLAKMFEVNRGTIITAYDILHSKGMIERIKGSGTKVSSDFWGMTRNRIPNWNLYVESGSFLPNLPVYQHIQDEIQERSLINFASGELAPDLTPYADFRHILSQNKFNHSLGYEHPQGNLELRNIVASHLGKYKGIDCTSQSILITSGAQQALYLIVQCLLHPGDSVAIENPSYAYSLPLFRSARIKTHLLTVGKQGVEPDDIVALYKKHKIKMIFLNPIFQNPTGTLLSHSRRTKILELSAELGIPVVEDDPYSLIPFSKETDTATLKSLDRNGNVLYISSLSKVVASGLRIGWIVGPQKVITRLADAKQQVDFGHSIFPQWIAAEFLRANTFAEHLVHIQQRLLEKRNLLIASLEQHLSDYVTFHIPEGGVHLWCSLKREVNEYRLLEAALRNGVVFVPGSLLCSEKSHMRLTFGRTETPLIEEGVLRLKQAFITLT